MLIELPLDEIKNYLYDFGRLYFKIGEAVNTLQQLNALMYLRSPDPKFKAYNQKGYSYITAAVRPENPNYKQVVDEFIYSYVEEIVGENIARKITDMLIKLPIEEIKDYL